MGTQISRRGFLATAAATGALATASAAMPAQADVAECDVLVIGAGFGGLMAACLLAEQGKKVQVVEASTRCGGTALLCSGIVGWGGSEITAEKLQASAPLTDMKLAQTYIDNWPRVTEWLLNSGAPLEWDKGNIRLDPSQPSPYGNYAVADWFERHLIELGASIAYQTTAIQLTTMNGVVNGAVVRSADGALNAILATDVVLACGGFQDSVTMRERYLGEWGGLMVNRGNPHNDGKGIQMGLEVGGVESRGMGTYYGYHQAWPFVTCQDVAEWDANITDSTWAGRQQSVMSNVQGFSSNCIVVNLQGKRYDNETQRDNVVTEATGKQKYAMGFVILDQSIRDEKIGMSAFTGTDRIDALEQMGAVIVKADTIEDLAEKLAAGYGMYRQNFLDTVNAYNEACAAGVVDQLEVPKTNVEKGIAIQTAPFYAIPVKPGVSTCYGGLTIDPAAHVVDRDANPIQGLYALPGCAGGLAYYESVGQLGSIMCFATAAADAILA